MREPTNVPALAVRDLHAWYGESLALEGVAFEAAVGEVVTLLGRNGAGKSTTLRAIMGMVTRRRGSIAVNGRETVGWNPEQIARAGVGYCPEERGIYASLTVQENLLLPRISAPGGISLSEIYTSFPNLHARRSSPGTTLSGGEQQMLAIGRLMRTGAQILLLDEPTEGLAPVIVQQIEDVITDLKAKGSTIVLVEQNLRFATSLGDRHILIENGQVRDVIERGDIANAYSRIERYLAL